MNYCPSEIEFSPPSFTPPLRPSASESYRSGEKKKVRSVGFEALLFFGGEERENCGEPLVRRRSVVFFSPSSSPPPPLLLPLTKQLPLSVSAGSSAARGLM